MSALAVALAQSVRPSAVGVVSVLSAVAPFALGVGCARIVPGVKSAMTVMCAD